MEASPSSATADAEQQNLIQEKIESLYKLAVAYGKLKDQEAQEDFASVLAMSATWMELKSMVHPRVFVMIDKQLAKAPLVLKGDVTIYEIKSCQEAFDALVTKKDACHKDRAMLIKQVLMKLWTFALDRDGKELVLKYK